MCFSTRYIKHPTLFSTKNTELKYENLDHCIATTAEAGFSPKDCAQVGITIPGYVILYQGLTFHTQFIKINAQKFIPRYKTLSISYYVTSYPGMTMGPILNCRLLR
jgi:hypothetical protein